MEEVPFLNAEGKIERLNMYKIIGADGRQYGPVSPEVLREWIAAARANAQTMVQAEGATDWKPLGSLPEFAEALAAKAPPPSAPTEPPIVAGVNADPLANEILARDYTLDIGHCLNRAWELMKANFWPIVGVSALILILFVFTASIYVGILLTGPLLGGLNWYYLKLIRGQKADLNDAFAGFTLAFVPLMLAGLVTSILESIGFFLCILPGIYLIVAWVMTFTLVLDKRLQFWDAMEVSRKVVSKHWWSFFGFFLLWCLINLGGLLLCGVGVFITCPWTSIAVVYAYEDIFGQTKVAATGEAVGVRPM
jgi:hypothetical protein